MRLFSRLGPKILLLVAIPLVLQLSLLAWVAHLQDEAEEEAQRALKSQQISDEVLDLIKDIYAVRTNFGYHDSVNLNPAIPSKYRTLPDSIEGHFRSLRELTPDSLVGLMNEQRNRAR